MADNDDTPSHNFDQTGLRPVDKDATLLHAQSSHELAVEPST